MPRRRLCPRGAVDIFERVCIVLGGEVECEFCDVGLVEVVYKNLKVFLFVFKAPHKTC